MQTCADMKDSGVAWLGKIPSSWPQKHARYLFRESKNLVGDNWGDYELLSLTLRGIIPRSEVEGGKNPEKYDAYQIVHDNDLVMCLFDYDVTPRTVGRVTQTGMLTGAYTNLKPYKGVSTRYYNYFFLSLDSTKELLHLCTGLRNGISKPVFFGLNLPFPDYDTQEKIADFLDTETAQIDNLIAKQERLLELLEEKRRATITHAVTRGLNPGVELKETNIPWLGQVPVHWELYRAKYLFEKIQEKPLDTDEVVTAFRDGEVVLRSLRRADGFTFADKEIGYQHVSVGDLVIHAMDAFAGAVGVSKSEGKMSPVCSICRPIRSGVDTEYYAQLVRAMTSTNYLVAIAKGIRERSTDFRFGDFSNMTFPLPPLDEQRGIISRINDENEWATKLKQKIQTQITLLRERRTSLISHVVTGKVKIT